MTTGSTWNEMQLEGRELLTIDAAARRAGVSRRSIYAWMEAGKIEFIRTAGGSVRIFADSLWVDARVQQ